MPDVQDLRASLLEGLSRLFPRNGLLLSVGLPGGHVGWAVAAARPDVAVVDVISEETMRASRGALQGILQCPGVEFAGHRDGVLYLSGQRALGGVNIATHEENVRYRALASLIADLKPVTLIHFSAAIGHARLLLSVLPALKASPAVIWLDLPRQTAEAEFRQVMQGPDATAFDIFCLSTRCFMSRASETPPREALAMILVPRAHRVSFGLALAADAETGEALAEALSADLVVDVDGPISPALLTRLRPALTVSGAPLTPDKIFLPAMTRVFATAGQISRSDEGFLIETGQYGCSLMFMAPRAGRFTISIVSADATDLQMEAGFVAHVDRTAIPLFWCPESCQLVSRRPLIVRNPGQPVTITVSDEKGRAKLKIKGVELQYSEAVDTSDHSVQAFSDAGIYG